MLEVRSVPAVKEDVKLDISSQEETCTDLHKADAAFTYLVFRDR